MRTLAMIAACLLAGCTTETITYVDIPMPTAKPAYATSVRPGGQRVMTIDRLYAWCERSLLIVQVTGSTNTGGWTEPRLNRVSNQDGLLTYELIAQPPQGRGDARVLEPFTIRHEDAWPNASSRVRIISQTNEMTSAIAPCPAF